MVRSIAVLLVGGLLSACAAPLWAQEAILGQTYGNGVHAYFSGEYVRAHQLLTSAIDAGSRDPRCYYFRGLAFLRLGRPQEAEADFQQGAKLETADVNKTYSVAKSLERIQGAPRAEVERYRVHARMAALDRSEKALQRRYEENNRLERQSLEQQAEAAPPKATSTEPIAAPVPTHTDNDFNVPDKSGPEPTPKASPEPAAKQAPEPTPKPEAKPAPEDPFAQPKPDAKPAEPAAEPAPAPSKNAAPDKKHGFGGALKQALGRALGGDESKAPAAKEKPDESPVAEPPAKATKQAEKAEKPEPAEEPAAKPAKPNKPLPDDPFADEPAAGDKSAKKSADKEPAAKKSSDKAPAGKKPADSGDPFS